MTSPRQPLSRRRFLALCLTGAAAVAGGFAVAKREAIRLVADKLRFNASPYRLDAATGTGALGEAQMATIVAFAGVLIPWQAGAATVAEMTRELVDGLCRYEPGAREAYVRAAALLDDEAGGTPFAALDAAARERVVAAVMPAPIRSRRDWRHVWNVFFRYEETRLAELVAGEILTAFYNDDRSWAYLAERAA
jgi:hypothetical protein